MKTWRPTIAAVEQLLALASGFRGMSHAEIAHEIGAADVAAFSAWFSKMRYVLAYRPDALANIKFVIALQREGRRPEVPIGPADLARRERALERAAALAAISLACAAGRVHPVPRQPS